MKVFFVRYYIALLAGLWSFASLFVIRTFANVWVFLLVVVGWILVMILLDIFFTNRVIRRQEHLLELTIMTVCSFVGLFILSEALWQQWFLMIMCAVLVGGLFGISRYQQQERYYHFKRVRRTLMMLWVFDAYALTTVLLALAVFFLTVPFWVWGVLIAVLFTYVTIVIWKQYFDVPARQFLFWGLLMFVMMIELVWVMRLLPFGYLVLGFFVTWLWYLLQLFIRFHLQPQGIVWRRHRSFLLVNLSVYVILLLFVIRWI